jgi:hypothetical protein
MFANGVFLTSNGGKLLAETQPRVMKSTKPRMGQERTEAFCSEFSHSIDRSTQSRGSAP